MNKYTLHKWRDIAYKHPIWMMKYTLERAGIFKMDDESFLRFIYEYVFERPLDLDNPRSYNEKLQWLKLNDRQPIYNVMVDKYEAKKYISNIIGEEYIVPTLGVWDSFDDIPFGDLPRRFVLKCTHDSGGNVIVRDREKMDYRAIRKKIKRCLKQNYFYQGREWQYKDIKPRVIAEQYLEDTDGVSINDYKILCFEGEAKLVEVHRNRFTDHHTQDFYDPEWNKMEIQQLGESNSSKTEDKPERLCELLRLSEKIAEGFHHLRIDWYIVKGRVFFGEITLYDSSGLCRFTDYRWDELLGSWIKLGLRGE